MVGLFWSLSRDLPEQYLGSRALYCMEVNKGGDAVSPSLFVNSGTKRKASILTQQCCPPVAELCLSFSGNREMSL